MASIPLYAFLANRVDLRWLMMFGLAMFGISMWYFAPITHDWGSAELLLPQALRGMAQQFAVAPTVTLTLGSLPPERLRLASGLFNLMRNLGGAIGIAACATVLNDRGNMHFLREAEHLNIRNEAMGNLLQSVSERFMAAGHDALDAQTAALRQLWGLAWREAQTQTFGDIYLLILVCFGIATAMVPLMRKVAAPKAPSADAH
ncbi:Multidrug export protein EmrB [compost metagenome]